jgi:hypothetical protein
MGYLCSLSIFFVGIYGKAHICVASGCWFYFFSHFANSFDNSILPCIVYYQDESRGLQKDISYRSRPLMVSERSMKCCMI